jgi:hypothetical protein
MYGVGRRAYPILAVPLTAASATRGRRQLPGRGIGSTLLVHALRQIAAASRYVGFEGVVVHAIDVTGLLVPPAESGPLAAAISTLLSMPERRASISRAPTRHWRPAAGRPVPRSLLDRRSGTALGTQRVSAPRPARRILARRMRNSQRHQGWVSGMALSSARESGEETQRTRRRQRWCRRGGTG